MQLFFDPDIVGPLHTLSADESRHAVRVLRLGVGSVLHITDGRGNLFECQVVNPSPAGCEVRVLRTFPEHGRRPYRLTMGVAPTKNSDRFEWFLEKATEVGVDVIVPLECAESERRVMFKPERALRVIAGAVKQSLKAYMPVLEPIMPLREVLSRPFEGLKLIAHCREELPRTPITVALAGSLATGVATPTVLADAPATEPTDIVILVGPEGDFTPAEIAAAEAAGFTSISLGESRLRTETAALAAVMAVYFK